MGQNYRKSACNLVLCTLFVFATELTVFANSFAPVTANSFANKFAVTGANKFAVTGANKFANTIYA